MTQTTIYLSVIRGKDTLILDGNLYLFKELLTTLHNVEKDLLQANPALSKPTQEIKQEGSNVTR